MFEEFFGKNRRNENEFRFWWEQMLKDYEKMFKSLEDRRNQEDGWKTKTWETPNGFGISRIKSSNLGNEDMENLMMELSRMMSPYSFDPYSAYRPQSYRRKKTFNPELELEFLGKELEAAIEEEDFEEAAKIRDEIKKIHSDLNEESDNSSDEKE
jgi:excinuclease UvrABC helicase subunit UvrB